MKTSHSELLRVVEWSMEAAAEHVAMAKLLDEIPDPEVCMGLRQSFEAEFDFEQLRSWGVLDTAFTLWSGTFSSTVRLLSKES